MIKKKLYAFICLALICIFGLNLSAFAEYNSFEPATIEEAKNYLLNYRILEVNEYGEESTLTYSFPSNESLECAASYIVTNGLDAFNDLVNTAVEDAIAEENTIAEETVMPLTVTPGTASTTISGNGSHSVSTTATGLATFPTLGNLSYSFKLSYTVGVQNGVITGVNSPKITFLSMGTGGTANDISLSSAYISYQAGVSASFTITKSVTTPLGFEIKSETDYENFTFTTYLAR